MESLKERIVAQLSNREAFPTSNEDMQELLPVFLLDNNNFEDPADKELYMDKASEKFFEASEVSDLDDSDPDYKSILVVKPDIQVELDSERGCFPDTERRSPHEYLPERVVGGYCMTEMTEQHWNNKIQSPIIVDEY